MSGRLPATALLVPLAVALALTACSGGGPAVPGDANPAYSATASPSPAFSPGTPPRDFRLLSGDGWSIAAPSAFQESTVPGQGGTTTLVLKHPSSVPQLPSGVVVITEPKPAQDVVQQMYALEVSKRALGGTDVVRSDVTWPGAVRSVLVQWDQQDPAGQTRVPMHYAQLAVQVAGGAIYSVVALTPQADRSTSQVLDVVRTFHVG